MSIQVKKDGRIFFIKTLGCKVNQYESQAMRELLVKAGFRECLSKETADVYIINTCTVTHKADHESRYWISMLHKTNPKARIVITGCSVEQDAAAFSFLPGISHIIKNEKKGYIAEILTKDESRRGGLSLPYGPDAQYTIPSTNDERRLPADLSAEAQIAKAEALAKAGTTNGPSAGSGSSRAEPRDDEPHRFLTITDFKDHAKAFVKIQDGCDNHCAYCKVPSVRGASRSKPLEDVVEEVGTLVAKGFKEIVLTGICLGAWGADLAKPLSLVDALRALDGISGSFRIRLSSIEPKYVTDELIDYIAQNRRLCRHLHIPVQSGDDEILRGMNRPYTSGQIKDLIIKVKKRIEGIGITTDILIGFPGESDKHFWNTVNLVKEILPVRTHIFPFSVRRDTAASSMNDLVPGDIVKKRFQRMKITAINASYLYRESFLSKQLEVLVETKREKHSVRLTGYSGNYIKVMFDGPDALMKNIVPVKIEELNLTYTLGVAQAGAVKAAT